MDDNELWDEARALKKAAKAEIKRCVSASARPALLGSNQLTECELMQFDELTKPKHGWSFWILKMLIDINLARTLTWCDQNDARDTRHTRYFSIHKVEKMSKKYKNSALCLIIGPIKVMIGIAT